SSANRSLMAPLTPAPRIPFPAGRPHAGVAATSWKEEDMATGISASNRSYTRLYWPWLLVGAAWVVAVAATLTGQRFLIDHEFLLEESGLPWPLAAALFLIGWQIMIAAMMAPT